MTRFLFMIQFDVITIFPEILGSYINESLIARARKKKLLKINVHNLRRWAKGAHKQVDHRPFGGGLGMVMMVEPIFKAVNALKGRGARVEGRVKRKTKVILFTPRGQKFTQKIAHQLAKQDQLIFLCGRYEGVDERVAEHIADMELSVGDYVLMGGELPALTVIETVSRLIPGVLGKPQLLKERVAKSGGFLEYAQYTRPEVFAAGKKKWKVPPVLLSGNHKNIEEWKKAHGRVVEE